MHRIDSDTRDQDKHGAGKDGFRSGDVDGEEPTDGTAEWHDAVQEEVSGVVEAFGLTLSKADHGQLYSALLRMVARIAIFSWVMRDAISTAEEFNAIAYGQVTGSNVEGGGFHAVGSGGTWLQENLLYDGTAGALKDVCRSGDNWIAVGVADGSDATILTTTDTGVGAAPTERSNPKNFGLNCVATDGANHVVALGVHDGADIYCVRSTDDGATWAEIALAGDAGDYVNAVCWAGGQYVAAGWDASEAAPCFWVSADGTTWTKYAAHASATAAPLDITHTGSRYVAVATDEIFTSADGITWDFAQPFTYQETYAVAAWPGTGVVVAAGRYIYTTRQAAAGGIISFDHGVTWEICDAIPLGVRALAFGGNRFAAVVVDSGAGSARIAYSGGIAGI